MKTKATTETTVLTEAEAREIAGEKTVLTKTQAAMQILLHAAEYIAKNPLVVKVKDEEGHEREKVTARMPLTSWMFLPNPQTGKPDATFILRIIATVTHADAYDITEALQRLQQAHKVCVDLEGLPDGWKSLEGLLRSAMQQRWHLACRTRTLDVKGRAFIRLPSVEGGRRKSDKANVVDVPDWAKVDAIIADEDAASDEELVKLARQDL